MNGVHRLQANRSRARLALARSALDDRSLRLATHNDRSQASYRVIARDSGSRRSRRSFIVAALDAHGLRYCIGKPPHPGACIRTRAIA
ncbi:Hypothetical protein XFF4834R_chr01790 [Xanthomonas citri pv. fuscans]|nr:Hypothetical protein XFF4834R_chr01790 [Xanthomonas citri pv. fuscans]